MNANINHHKYAVKGRINGQLMCVGATAVGLFVPWLYCSCALSLQVNQFKCGFFSTYLKTLICVIKVQVIAKYQSLIIQRQKMHFRNSA